MFKIIVLLRGINVGGHKKIPMIELRKLLAQTGFEAVKTYIQSGNIILNTSEKSQVKIERIIKKLILDYFGFEVPVIIKTRNELKRVFERCPFSEEKKEKSYFILLSDIPNAELVNEVSKINYENEEYHIIDNCIYLYSSKGYGDSKFNMNLFEKKLEVKATSRNFNTMMKLIAMSL